jgi:hypothetical protein
MPMVLLIAIEVSILTGFGVALALKQAAASRRVAQIRVIVDNPRKKIGQDRR